MGNLTAAANDPLRIVLLTYEFTYSPFSGNGILSRSLAKSLLELGCQLSVWCCRPAPDHASTDDNPLAYPEISEEDASRLDMYAVTLPEEVGWRRLDAESGWREFSWQFLSETDDSSKLASALEQADVICTIDWTGGCAYRSIPQDLWSDEVDLPPMVYLNFRVYSSGVSDVQEHEWYDNMERQALVNAQTIIVLSEKDRKSLQDLMDSSDLVFPARERIHILHPPLRADIERLAKLPPEQIQSNDLPCQHSVAMQDYHGQHNCFVTCLVRLSPEKDAMRFIKFIEATSHILAECGLTPLLAGAASDEDYANRVKGLLKCVAPHAIIIESFLSPSALAAVFSRTALNFHPCSYDAYGMTIVEAAAFGVPSVVASGNVIGATAIVSGEGVFEVEMPPIQKNGGRQEPDLTGPGITELSAILRDRPRMKKTGLVAKKQALAWDEKAYGSSLIEHIDHAIDLYYE